MAGVHRLQLRRAVGRAPRRHEAVVLFWDPGEQSEITKDEDFSIEQKVSGPEPSVVYRDNV